MRFVPSKRRFPKRWYRSGSPPAAWTHCETARWVMFCSRHRALPHGFGCGRPVGWFSRLEHRINMRALVRVRFLLIEPMRASSGFSLRLSDQFPFPHVALTPHSCGANGCILPLGRIQRGLTFAEFLRRIRGGHSCCFGKGPTRRAPPVQELWRPG